MRVVVERVVEREGDAARIAEDAIDAFPGQAFEQHLGATHQIRHDGDDSLDCSWDIEK